MCTDIVTWAQVASDFVATLPVLGALAAFATVYVVIVRS